MNVLLSVIFGIITAAISFKLKLLNLKGALVTFILAVIIFYFGGVKWSTPILTFFILSSILSKIRKRVNPSVDSYFQKSDTRDHFQVLANGGFPGIMILLNQVVQLELFYIAYVSAIAAACSDTWATEIGTLFNFKTYNIINFAPVEQGISGGVSAVGFAGAILGAMIILFSAIHWISSLEAGVIIFASGFTGSVLDSVIGASLQAKYKCMTCNKITERKIHCGTPSIQSAGLSWLNNDGVNFASCSASGVISIVLVSQIAV